LPLDRVLACGRTFSLRFVCIPIRIFHIEYSSSNEAMTCSFLISSVASGQLAIDDLGPKHWRTPFQEGR
jgi:hypothetical protein